MKYFILALILALSALAPAKADDTSTSPLAGLTEADVRAIVEDYIRKNPTVIVEAIQQWNYDQRVAQMLPAINVYRGWLERSPDYPVMGNPDGDITIVEFFDYRCGFCKRHYPVIRSIVEQDGNIRYVTRQFPLKDQPGQPALSMIAARAALAAHKQGLYEEFHHAMIQEPSSYDEARIYAVAGSVGLNVTQLRQDMGDPLITKNIRNTVDLAKDIGFSGTPAYIIGDQVVMGAQGPQAMLDAIERARASAKASREEAAAAGR